MRSQLHRNQTQAGSLEANSTACLLSYAGPMARRARRCDCSGESSELVSLSHLLKHSARNAD
jgi:hypothetical protein